MWFTVACKFIGGAPTIEEVYQALKVVNPLVKALKRVLAEAKTLAIASTQELELTEILITTAILSLLTKYHSI